MNIEISVIIPAYNAESYIANCIESVLNQDFKGFEIIIVDDGSSDNTLEICRDYEIKNENIRVIHKKNGGVSSARNTGIIKAKGKYLIFIDSDDFIEDDYLSMMYNASRNSTVDLVASGFIEENEHGTIILERKIENNDFTSENKIISKLINKLELGYSVGKLYKKEIIDGYNLKFDEKMTYAEDKNFVFSFASHISSISIVSDTNYHVLKINNNSLSTHFVNNIDYVIDELRKSEEKLSQNINGFRIEYEKLKINFYVETIALSILNNYKHGSPYNFKERTRFIKTVVNNNDYMKFINIALPISKFEKIFVILFKFKMSFIMNLIFSAKLVTMNFKRNKR